MVHEPLILVLLLCTLSLGQGKDAAISQAQPSVSTWEAEIKGEPTCVGRDILTQCTGYKQIIGQLNVSRPIVISEIEYKTTGRFSPHRSFGNSAAPFIRLSDETGRDKRIIYLSLTSEPVARLTNLSASFPAGTLLNAVYMTAFPSPQSTSGVLTIRYITR